MAIKKRAAVDKTAAIEAFGDGAEPRYEAPIIPAATSRGGVPKTMLIRYPDTELPEALANLARLEERSQHATALRALRRGIAELEKEARA